MPTKKTSDQTHTATVLILSYGNTKLLHKSLVGALELGNIVNDIYIHPTSVGASEAILKYQKSNDLAAKKPIIRFANHYGEEVTLKEVVGQKKTSHIVVLPEGACIDSTSINRLISNTGSGMLSYPEVCVEFKNTKSLNRILINPDIEKDPYAVMLSTLSNINFVQGFAVRYDACVEDISLPIDSKNDGKAGWRLFLDLLAHNISPTRISRSAIFMPSPKITRLHWKNTPSIVTTYNSLANLKRRKSNSTIPSPSTPKSLKQKIKYALRNNPQLSLAGQKTLHLISIAKSHLPSIGKRLRNTLSSDDYWIISAAEDIHTHNSSVFVSDLDSFPFTKENLSSIITDNNTLIDQALKSLQSDRYDYILIVPWLIAGGADMFFVNYANVIARMNKNKKVLILSTEPSRKSLTYEQLNLDKSVDFVRLAEIVEDTESGREQLFRMLPTIIELAQPQVIHIGLSEFGYQYIKKYQKSIRELDRKIILTGYNEIVTNKRREGYVHDIMPDIFEVADIITTDNQRIIDIWEREYALPSNKAIIHHQPFAVPSVKRSVIPEFSKDRPVRVLWAAHIRKEKNPETFRRIADALKNDKRFSFTAFGAHDKAHYTLNPFTNRTKSVLYGGEYKNFNKDVQPDNFDIFVYTSHSDGTPNILIEVGMSEMPIISSSVGGIAPLIQNNGSLIEDPVDVKEYIKHLRAFADNPKPYQLKAVKLKQHLLNTQTLESFEKEVAEMLDRIEY